MSKVGIFVFLVIFFIFRPWFTFSGTFSSGDWPYLFRENIENFSFFSKEWVLWLTPYYQSTAKVFVDYLGFPWELVERTFWFWPLLFIAVFSSYYLTRSWLGVLIYVANTYFLMLVTGGQMGIAMGYALSPLVLAMFITFVSLKSNIKHSIGTCLALAVQMMFDPRIAYITMLAVIIYYVFFANFKSLLRIFPLIGAAIFLNSFWIIHFFQGDIPHTRGSFDSLEGLIYFSFSDFSHAFSLLHPNWPENIFGKVYFLQPEFLVIPILAYSALLFVRKEDKNIIFFALLGILGAFLAKGASEPFGAVNMFLFEYIPGMQLFRDPTKFYLLIGLSYSVLIPYAIFKISKKVSSIKYQILSILFIVFWVFTIRQAVLGQLSGTFKPQPVPKEYIKLKDFLHNQPEEFSTFWTPSVQRFGYSSKMHPAIFGDIHDIPGTFAKYVIVPYDSQKEIFITDRKYDENLRDDTVRELERTPNLKRVGGFAELDVFELTK